MDISKFCIPTLDGPNWGQWLDQIQSTVRILDIWDAMRGEILTPAPNLTRDLLAKPSQLATNATATDIAMYTTAKAIWSKKNAQGLGLIQATVSNVIWQKHASWVLPTTNFWMSLHEFCKAKGQRSWTKLVPQQVLNYEEHREKVCQVW